MTPRDTRVHTLLSTRYDTLISYAQARGVTAAAARTAIAIIYAQTKPTKHTTVAALRRRVIDVARNDPDAVNPDEAPAASKCVPASNDTIARLGGERAFDPRAPQFTDTTISEGIHRCTACGRLVRVVALNWATTRRVVRAGPHTTTVEGARFFQKRDLHDVDGHPTDARHICPKQPSVGSPTTSVENQHTARYNAERVQTTG